MPVFEIQGGEGKTFEIDAPDIHAAASALGAPTIPDDKYHAAARQELAANEKLGLGASPVARRILQGATFNTADEIMAGMQTPIEMFKRGTLDPREGYNYAKAQQDLSLENARKDSGAVGTAAEILGGIGSGAGLSRAGVGLLGRLGPNAGLGSRSLASAVDAAGYGAVAGAGEGNSLAERGQNAALGAGTGAVLGGVAPGAIQLAGGMVAPVVSNIRARFNPAGFAQSQVARAVSESGQTPQQIADSVTNAARAGQDVFTVADAMGNPGQRMLSTVTRAPGPGRTEAVNFMDARQAGQGRRVSNILAEGFDSPQTAEQTAATLTGARDAAANSAYAAARRNAGPVDLTRVISNIDQTLTPGANQIARPQSGLANDSIEAALENVRRRLTDNRSMLTDFTAVQRVRDDLADMVQQSTNRGQGNRARLLGGVLRQMDAAMGQASPRYLAANAAYHQQSQVIGATDQGRQAAMRGRTEDIVPAFRAASPAQQQAFRAGYVDPLIQQVQGGAVGANKARPFTSDAFRTEAAAMAPQRTGNQMTQRLARENTMFETRAQATGGSRTADNLADASALGIEPSLVGNILHGNWASAARQLLSAGSNVLSGNTAEVRHEVGRLLLMRGANVSGPQLQQLLSQAVNTIRTRQMIASRLGSGLLAGGAVTPSAIGQR